MLASQPHGQRVLGKHHGVQRRHRTPYQLGIELGRWQPVQLMHPPLRMVNRRDHQLVLKRLQVVCGKHLKRQPGIDHYHDGRLGMKTALRVDMGMGQVIVVTGRASEAGNATQRGVQSGQHLLFSARQAIQQRERKTVLIDRCHRLMSAAVQQGVDQ